MLISKNSIQLRSKSPIQLRSKSPNQLRSKSPSRLRSKSPNQLRSKSPSLLRSKSPSLLRSKSPSLLRSKSPNQLRSKSPNQLRSKSPNQLRSKSPNQLRSKSPNRLISSKSTNRIRSKSVSPKRTKSTNKIKYNRYNMNKTIDRSENSDGEKKYTSLEQKIMNEFKNFKIMLDKLIQINKVKINYDKLIYLSNDFDINKYKANSKKNSKTNRNQLITYNEYYTRLDVAILEIIFGLTDNSKREEKLIKLIIKEVNKIYHTNICNTKMNFFFNPFNIYFKYDNNNTSLFLDKLSSDINYTETQLISNLNPKFIDIFNNKYSKILLCKPLLVIYLGQDTAFDLNSPIEGHATIIIIENASDSICTLNYYDPVGNSYSGQLYTLMTVLKYLIQQIVQKPVNLNLGGKCTMGIQSYLKGVKEPGFCITYSIFWMFANLCMYINLYQKKILLTSYDLQLFEDYILNSFINPKLVYNYFLTFAIWLIHLYFDYNQNISSEKIISSYFIDQNITIIKQNSTYLTTIPVTKKYSSIINDLMRGVLPPSRKKLLAKHALESPINISQHSDNNMDLYEQNLFESELLKEKSLLNSLNKLYIKSNCKFNSDCLSNCCQEYSKQKSRSRSSSIQNICVPHSWCNSKSSSDD
jgi:hypothetical protein